MKAECSGTHFLLTNLIWYLQQLSGARKHRYPDTKMKEFEKKVEELENEYKR